MSTVKGHGIDLVECRRIEELTNRYGRRFLQRVFTPSELDYCMVRKRKWEHLAGRFAAKEAVLKVLGTGWRGRIAWTDIEINNTDSGQPKVTLKRYTQQLAKAMGVTDILISISHTDDHATASAISLGNDDP